MHQSHPKEVESFRYLESYVDMKGGVKTEVRSRVKEGSKVFGAIRNIWKCKSVNMSTKRSIYERVIVPSVLYGAETWNVKVAERRMLNVLKMK